MNELMVRAKAPSPAEFDSKKSFFEEKFPESVTFNENFPDVVFINSPTDDEQKQIIATLEYSNLDFSTWEFSAVALDEGGFVELNPLTVEPKQSSLGQPVSDDDDETVQDMSVFANKAQEMLREKRDMEEKLKEMEAKNLELEKRALEAEREKQELIERDEQRLQAIGKTEEGMLNYLVDLSLPVEEMEEVILPKFTASDATNAISNVVGKGIVDTNRKSITAILPAVSLSIENKDERTYEDSDTDYEDDFANELMISYLEESERLSTAYDNARIIVQSMSDDEFNAIQAIVHERLDDKSRGEIESVENIRAEMLNSVNELTDMVEANRSDYADGMKEAMQAAALQAARDYAATNKEGYIIANDMAMLEKTADVADAMVSSSSRAYRTLMVAEHNIDDSDLTTEQRKQLHAYLSSARYRIQADRAMGSYISDMSRDRLEQLQSMDDDLEDFDDELDFDASDGSDLFSDDDLSLDDLDEDIAELEDEDDDLDLPQMNVSDESQAFHFDDSPIDLSLLESDSDNESAGASTTEDSDDLDLTNILSSEPISDDSSDIDLSLLEDEQPKKKGLFGLKKSKKKAKPAKVDKPKKKMGKLPIILASVSVAAALGVGGLYFAKVGPFAPQQQAVNESQTDPRGIYKSGDQYQAVLNKDGKNVEVTITIGKFVDADGDANDYIVATDADGNQYKISYDKMAQLSGNEQQ